MRRLEHLLVSLVLVPCLALSQGIITTVAGNGLSGNTGDGGAATSARLNAPNGVSFDASGALYIADAGNNSIRRVTSGNVSFVVTLGLGNPFTGIADNIGNVFVAFNNSLYKFPAGSQSYVNFNTTGGPCCGLAVDSAGNLFYVTSTFIFKIRPDASNVQVASGLTNPAGIAVDSGGNLYVADKGAHRIRKVGPSGSLTTIAGTGVAGFSGDGGAATSAQLDSPTGVAVDNAGNIYVSDTNNLRIRKINPAGTITTIAGNGLYGFSGDGGSATSAMMTNPTGIAVDAGGHIYFADTNNNRIRKVTAGVSGTVGSSSIQALAGVAARIPITLNLTTGAADSVGFSFRATPVGNAPALTGALSFQQAAGLSAPDTVDTGVGPDTISVFWSSISPSLSGTNIVGNVMLTVPAAATIGQTYTLQITGASASTGSTAVVLGPGPNSILTVALDYLVGDTFPITTDDAGSFGDATINTLDLINALRAVTSVPGYRPAACKDRFDAMDSFPVDTANARGGDGFLNTLDLIATLRRSTGIDTSRPRRVSRALVCSEAPPENSALPSDAPGTAGNLFFGQAVKLETGVLSVPVYLETKHVLSLAALSFSLGDGQSQLHFLPAKGRTPSIADSGAVGVLSIAWLSGFGALANQRVLLGYVDAPRPADLRFYGVNGNAQSDGQNVSLGFNSSIRGRLLPKLP